MHNKTRSQRDMSHAVLFATGPWLLRDAFKAATGEPGQLAVGYAGEHEVRGTRIMVYSLGQWCARPPPTLLRWLTQHAQPDPALGHRQMEATAEEHGDLKIASTLHVGWRTC